MNLKDMNRLLLRPGTLAIPEDNEARFLVACVDFAVTGQGPCVRDHLLPSLSWERIISLASNHRVLPAVHYALQNIWSPYYHQAVYGFGYNIGF